MSKNAIVVCGGGIVGLAAALGLAKSRQAVSLLAPRALVHRDTGDDYCPRVYAISPATQRYLHSLGVWELLNSARVTPVEGMAIFGDASGKVALDAWHGVQSALAWIVESSELEAVLQQAVKVYGLPWIDDKFQALGPESCITEAGRTMPAALVVGADGAQSPVRTAAGIEHRVRSYKEVGLVTHLDVERPHAKIAYQWFGVDGVLALLPMPDTAAGPQVSMVWSMRASQADELLAMSGEERNHALEHRLASVAGAQFGRFKVRRPVLGFPLTLETSDMVAPGVALVGDAAHRIHPLAGQGLNLGLGDVEQLVHTVAGRPTYRGPGDIRILRRYRRVRAEPVAAMVAATDGLHRLFASSFAPVVLTRNMGMHLVDRLPFIKRRLILAASGE